MHIFLIEFRRRKNSHVRVCMPLRFWSTKITSRILIGQNIWRHFRPWNIKKMTYFFDKSKVALEFLQHRGSKLKFINLERNYYFFFDFQPVTLSMDQVVRSPNHRILGPNWATDELGRTKITEIIKSQADQGWLFHVPSCLVQGLHGSLLVISW